ncbi:hypothetical protein [Sulfitobacter mediterraneus]|uniref:Uncharacterized protein n=1 Tax=Sulfitobacter mediterraneus TaxID=83219 RepID=A0A061SRG8_9RHOB|nr:hypothetical protein [Sulfitobacter mediterraneus]KAJ04281.1 hypothetical protein PM02_04715 [Sulfitobacter mediterraneus]
MFWETMGALLLVVGTFPLWFLVAIVWGLVKAGAAFFYLAMVFFGQDPIEWSQILSVPFGTVIAGFEAAWGIPQSIWAWGKFEHPIWAAIIGLICLIGSRGARRG